MSDVEQWTDSRLNAAGALYTDNPHLGDPTIVHPIFHKASFKDISDADYSLIESSLRLASAYLNELSTLSFLVFGFCRPCACSSHAKELAD